ncbi:MAG TPA: protease inhibitor I42 family protein [Terriglobales bacterium]|nr:protease inhibitor I42 family protein [Terriglobales bacterium]
MENSYSEADNGKTVELKPGESLSVSLREARTGGYHWELTEGGGPVVQPSESEPQAPPSAVPGAPNSRSWQFTARQAGTARIQLEHRRPWEKGPASREFTLTVKVAA